MVFKTCVKQIESVFFRSSFFKGSWYKKFRKCQQIANLMLRELTKNEVSKFLRLVTEMEDSPVFADDPVLLLTHVDDELCAENGVVTRSDDANLQQTNQSHSI